MRYLKDRHWASVVQALLAGHLTQEQYLASHQMHAKGLSVLCSQALDQRRASREI